MANVIQCDLCGRIFTPYHKHPKGEKEYFRISTYYAHRSGKIDEETVTTYDACPNCERAFEDWRTERSLKTHG